MQNQTHFHLKRKSAYLQLCCFLFTVFDIRGEHGKNDKRVVKYEEGEEGEVLDGRRGGCSYQCSRELELAASGEHFTWAEC